MDLDEAELTLLKLEVVCVGEGIFDWQVERASTLIIKRMNRGNILSNFFSMYTLLSLAHNYYNEQIRI
jgi:hypothetical protein